MNYGKRKMDSASFIVGSLIEYDIKSCNINILREINYIDDKIYNELNSSTKLNRNIKIGLMMREDKKMYEAFSESRDSYVKSFIEDNDLTDNVLEIALDACWVIGKHALKREYGRIEFIPKRSSTSCFQWNNISFYFNSVTEERFARGGVKCETDYFIYDVIFECMKLKENSNTKKLYEYIHKKKIYYTKLKHDSSERLNPINVKKDMERNKNLINDINYKIMMSIIDVML